MTQPTITDTILMIRPANFGFNQETASNNAFQDANANIEDAAQRAIAEFDNFVLQLRAIGVDVIIVEDSVSPSKPDAIFPNNWISFHDNGTIVTYPMYAPIRRLERREDIVLQMVRQFQYNNRINLEQHERTATFLEGTGSLILDRTNRIAYACLSERTHEDLFREYCQQMDYQAVCFDALDQHQQPIYHTNVMMALGVDFAVVCLDSIANQDRAKVLDVLAQSNKDIIDISLEQMNNFAGNMLQVQGQDAPYLVMSQSAYNSLTNQQLASIKKHTQILVIPIPTIEQLGGGSVRCMMAEVFKPIDYLC